MFVNEWRKVSENLGVREWCEGLELLVDGRWCVEV